MAGIGFELRKLVEKRTLRGFFEAAFSGTIIVAGPWLISAASVAAAQRLPFLAAADVALAFIGAMVWAFALSLCLTTGPLYIFVRLSADLVYERKEGEAATLLLKAATAVFLVSLPAGYLLSLFLVGDIPYPGLFRTAFAFLLASVNVLWVAMMTVTVLRKYGRILGSYALGMLLMYVLAAILGPRYGAAGALAALALGYGLTCALLISATALGLGLKPYPKAFSLLAAHGKRFFFLAAAGSAYAFGTWADKIILWFFKGDAAAGTRFFVFPLYDTAFYYANLALIPGLVYFTLATETDFHLDLKRFLVFLSRRRYPEIEAARMRLGRNARRALVNQASFQGVVSVALALVSLPLAGLLGFSHLTFALLLGAGFFQLILLSALNMLFYLELYRNAALCSMLFFLLNAGLSIWAGLPSAAPPIDGFAYLVACAASAVLGLVFAFKGLDRFDQIVFLRASGERFGS